MCVAAASAKRYTLPAFVYRSAAMLTLRIATCMHLPEPDPDAQPLAEALAEAGVRAELAAWDDPAVDWDAPIATLLRTTWNYALAPEAFLTWIDRVATAAPLWNSRAIVGDNIHKRYLLELPGRGIAAVPTLMIQRGHRAGLIECAEHFRCQRLVVKPAIGAGSLDTESFSRAANDGDRFAAHVDRLASRGDVLVQPFVDAVVDPAQGERSLVWIDGEFSHAIRKTPRFAGDAERIAGPVAFAEDEVALARAAIAPLADQLLYARIDLTRDRAGQPMVTELEFIEPSLFFSHRPGSAARLVAGLQRRLSSSHR